ncbi:MAG: LamG domain-containing protein [Candidatus Poribacteria bacterium]|nr:LamG domain-containing protein [Candidatus Poribacteria bacterium]
MKITRWFVALVVAAAIPVSITHAQIDTLPIMALSFEEGKGDKSEDVTGNGLDATLKDVAWVDGKYGKGLNFNGTIAYAVVKDDPLLLLADGGTLMAWSFIRTGAGHASWPRIMIKAPDNGGTVGMDFLFDRAGAYGLRFCIGGACNTIPSAPVMEEWTHVAITFDGTDIIAYIDAEEVGRIGQPGPPLDTTGFDLVIGSGADFARPYDGIHDEIRIFDVPLDKKGIQFHMDTTMNEILAVEPGGKSATTWGAIKSR